MKPPLISTFILLLLAIIFPAAAQNGAHSVSQGVYRVGEKLTYNISYSSFPSAAHAEFEVVSRGMFYGREGIQLRAHLETTGVVNVALFALNNDYLTYIDPETGLPFHSQETARDAIATAEASHDFPQPAGDPPQNASGLAGTFDFLSAFYRARALPLASGGEYDLTVRSEGVDYPIELKVVGMEKVRTNAGSFDTIVTQVKANSRFKNVKVYFTSDERRMPVLFTGRVNSGELRAELAASEMIAPPPRTPKPTPSVAPNPAAPSATPEATATVAHGGWPFPLNEQLNFQIFVGSGTTPMGSAHFQVKGRSKYYDRDGIFLTVTAQTTNAAAQVFVARDQVDSYVDPKALLPYRTVLNLLEGKRRLTQTLITNQETGSVNIDGSTRIEVPVGTHDYVSFFYALRTFDLSIGNGKRNVVPMLVENKLKTISVTALKREQIGLGQRVIPAIALSITTDDPEADKYQLRLWVSDDQRRLPLRLTAMTQLGPVRADLAILPTSVQ